MSINHIVKSSQEPKYDIYVRSIDAKTLVVEEDIECKNLEVTNNLQALNINCDDLTAENKVEANLMEAKLQMTMNVQVNTNDIVQFYGVGLSASLPDNPFLKDISNGSNLKDFSPIYVYAKTRYVDDGSRYATTYNINFSAVGELPTSDEGSFDFKALNPFTFFTVPSYSSQNTNAGVIGSNVSAYSVSAIPDDPANDKKINFEFPTVSGGERDNFDFTIITYFNNNNPPYP
jgi:hypothetical protein